MNRSEMKPHTWLLFHNISSRMLSLKTGQVWGLLGEDTAGLKSTAQQCVLLGWRKIGRMEYTEQEQMEVSFSSATMGEKGKL